MILTKEKRTELIAKIESRVTVQRDGCWAWNSKSGLYYPMMKVDGQPMLIRRLVYRLYKRIDLGERTVTATCHNPLCVNPDHLVPGWKGKGGRKKKRIEGVA